MAYARERFVLEPKDAGKVAEVLEVQVDGIALPADRYELLDGNILRVDLDEAAQSKMLKVLYQMQ